ncbi:hypothetical protein JCM8097_007521 [Rhodosporidiobolus ruineniae]
MSNAEQTVILGSGDVGLSTAYYVLKLSPTSKVVLVENSLSRTIAGGASSFAGGFITGGSSWHDGLSTSLAALSWASHLEMADDLDGAERWGFRECGAAGLNVGGLDEDRSEYRHLPQGAGRQKLEGVGKDLPEGTWVEGEREELSTDGGVGQVDPAQFCSTVYTHLAAYPKRFQVVFGKPTTPPPSSSLAERNLLVHLTPDPTSSTTSSASSILLPFTKLVIAAGPWSGAVCTEFGLSAIPLTNLPGHSLLIRPSLSGYLGGDELPSEAVFAGIAGAVGGVHASTSGLARGLTDEEKKEGYTRSPELFCRKNGLVFVAGDDRIPETTPAPGHLDNKLPPTVDGVKDLLDPNLIKRLKHAAGAASPLLKEENGAVIEAEQFCYRPVFADREPAVGELEKDIYLATGHGPWGIALAPGTGKVIAELALGLPVSADIEALSPARFSKPEYKY